MCITYEVEGSLYVNVTNRCSNRCTFCIRNNADGAYGSDSLWLEREPTVEGIEASVLSHDLSAYRELVFCGYGEPSYRLDDIRRVALVAKAKLPTLKTRINTNGHSDLIHSKDTAPLYKDAFDTVSISLNAPTREEYADICLPVYGESAFDAMLDFASHVSKQVQNTVFSVVGEFLSADQLMLCQALADSVGIKLRVREYIGPES